MEEKKGIKISLKTAICIFIIIILIITGGSIFYLNTVKQDEKTKEQNQINTIQEENKQTKENEYSIIYSKCEQECPGIIYRRETGGSTPFFIENGILYSGEKGIEQTQNKTTGIIGSAKYVVPLDKHTGKTIVLTEDGKLFTNKENSTFNGLYDNNFETALSNYETLEILQIPNEEELLFLTKTGKILYLNGNIYLDLQEHNDLSTENTFSYDKNTFAGIWHTQYAYNYSTLQEEVLSHIFGTQYIRNGSKLTLYADGTFINGLFMTEASSRGIWEYTNENITLKYSDGHEKMIDVYKNKNDESISLSYLYGEDIELTLVKE